MRARSQYSRMATGATIFAAVLFFGLPLIPAHANDSSAELATGGLVFVKNDNIEMASEDLFISTTSIRVRYRFINRAHKDVVTHVAFPLPDLKMDLDDDVTAFPLESRTDDPNFLDFTTKVNGHVVTANVEQKSLLNGRDQTSTLKGLGLSLSPYGFDASTVADSTIADLRRFGLLNAENIPLWTLKTTFYWEQTFVANQETIIEHRYKPSVGETVGIPPSSLVRVLRGKEYERYCVDNSFIRSAAQTKDYTFEQRRIEYVLTTGANWAGPIKQFNLIIDKGAPENLVSFCGEHVEKSGATQFRMRISNFIPMRNLAVLILKTQPPWSGQEEIPPAPPDTAKRSCDELWRERNSIFKAAGYCFKTGRAIRRFGNAGCQYDNLADVALPPDQRTVVNEISAKEAAQRCSQSAR